MRARLFIVSGPSGAGKSSLCAALLERCPKLVIAVSCTTRPPRPGEVDGREYHFLDRDLFEKQKAAGDFLEWAYVHGNMYGTRQSDVESVLASGRDVLLEIDWQGAAQVAARIPDAIRIFILPPSLEALRERLQARAQDDDDVIARRVAAASDEIKHADEAHIQIVNESFDEALGALVAIVQEVN